MKIGEAERWLQQQLGSTNDASEAAAIAAIAMEHVTGFSRPDRLSKTGESLNEQQLNRLTEITRRLSAHEPVQYILGEAPFAGMKLYVDNAVLVPRPETEELVQWIIDDVRAAGIDVFNKEGTEADKTTTLKILDVGTGSGCIALALKKTMTKAEVWGCDVSEDGLNVARRNGSELDIRVDFQGINFLDEAQQKFLPTVDIIVSNPPYIPLKDKETMQANVVSHEPHTALFVPDNDPLIFYRAIAHFGKNRLHNGGSIYVEIHEELGAAVKQVFEAAGYTNVVVKKDMQGKDRMVMVTSSQPSPKGEGAPRSRQA